VILSENKGVHRDPEARGMPWPSGETARA